MVVTTLLDPRPGGVLTYGRGLIRALAGRRPERGHWQVYRWTRAMRRRFIPAPELVGYKRAVEPAPSPAAVGATPKEVPAS